MGDLSDFQTRQTVGACLAGASVTETAILFRRIQNSSIQGYNDIFCSPIKEVPHAYSKAGNAKELHIFSLECYWT